MKKFNGLTKLGVVVVAVAMLSVTVFAASAYSNPAEAVAGLTGRDVDSVITERQESGESYGTIADKAGVLEAFEAEMLQIRKDIIAKRVADGRLTQERADEIIAIIEERAAECDGDCTAEDRGFMGQAIGGMFGGMRGGMRGGAGCTIDSDTAVAGQGTAFGGMRGSRSAERGIGQVQA